MTAGTWKKIRLLPVVRVEWKYTCGQSVHISKGRKASEVLSVTSMVNSSGVKQKQIEVANPESTRNDMSGLSRQKQTSSNCQCISCTRTRLYLEMGKPLCPWASAQGQTGWPVNRLIWKSRLGICTSDPIGEAPISEWGGITSKFVQCNARFASAKSHVSDTWTVSANQSTLTDVCPQITKELRTDRNVWTQTLNFKQWSVIFHL